MKISNTTIWVIMSKDRKVIAKGTPRNRELVLIGKQKDRKRFLTYSSKGMAEAGFSNGNWFCTWEVKQQTGIEYKPEDMEAVECKQIIETV